MPVNCGYCSVVFELLPWQADPSVLKQSHVRCAKRHVGMIRRVTLVECSLNTIKLDVDSFWVDEELGLCA